MTTNANARATAPAIERRVFPAAELRVDGTAGDGGVGKLRGHAAVFGMTSDDLGGFREIVEPGAFSDTLKADDIRALFNHDASLILGRNKAGTLTLAEDRRGLAIEIDLPDTGAGRDLAESVRRGDVSQMSFGFRTIDDIWERQEGEIDLRRLQKVQLFDVSPATFPAYPQTDLAMRSREAWCEQHGHPPADRAAVETPHLDAARRKLSALGVRVAATGPAGAATARGAVPMHAGAMMAAGAAWARPALGDFTGEAWGDLSREEQRRIVNHAAGYAGSWPETFDDIHLWHHKPGTSGVGPLVPRGLFASAGRFDQVQGVDQATLRGMARHLVAHYKQMEMDPPEALVGAAG